MSEDGWVDVVKRYRLWEAVPPDERVTASEIASMNARRGYVTDVAAREIEALNNPRCGIALKKVQYPRKWVPCALPVKPGADRCFTHGGPSSVGEKTTPAPTRADLLAEIERLRRLANE